MKKHQLASIIMCVIISLLFATLVACVDDAPNVKSTTELNSLISSTEKEKINEIISAEYFATYCNEKTISILYEKFKSKTIITSALEKAVDKTLGDKKCIEIMNHSEDGKDNPEDITTLTPNMVLNEFDVGKTVPKSVDWNIRVSLKSPSTLVYLRVSIWEIEIEGTDSEYFLLVDYSAQNGFGAMVDTYWFVGVDKNLQFDHKSDQRYPSSSYIDPVWEE